jgi:hypothetical protein
VKCGSNEARAWLSESHELFVSRAVMLEKKILFFCQSLSIRSILSYQLHGGGLQSEFRAHVQVSALQTQRAPLVAISVGSLSFDNHYND